MSGDRDLLQAAAKAAGIEVVCWNDGGEPYSSGLGFILPSNRLWNPLDSDGDALRLAVKLNIGVRPHGPDHWQQPNVVVALWDAGEQAGRVVVASGDDPQRATRRAITRAAAAMAERPAQGAE